MASVPAVSWDTFKLKLGHKVLNAYGRTLIGFWLLGLINNVLYVIILSAALDLVGPSIPKGVVLLADVAPSFLIKLIAPYFIHVIPYGTRVLVFVALSVAGMLLVALSPDAAVTHDTGAIMVKLFGVALASLSSGGGELSFLGLTHYYDQVSLAAWSSGTGGAGLVGAGAYVVATTSIGLSSRTSLIAFSFLPAIMLLSFFMVLPPRSSAAQPATGYERLNETEDAVEANENEHGNVAAAAAAAAEDESLCSSQRHLLSTDSPPSLKPKNDLSVRGNFLLNVHRARSLFFPFMLPLLLVYIAEYSINQGVAPTLLFPLQSTPFSRFRDFYPTYNAIYQVGVLISRSSIFIPSLRIHNLYLPSLLQCANLFLLIAQALWDFIPSVWLVFGIVFWEGLLGGAVYVNTFAEIRDTTTGEQREFSLSATTVSDSGGIMIAAFIGMGLEKWLCSVQVRQGKDWCTRL